MLCPKCGTDVGDEIRLCDRCEKLRRFEDGQEVFEGVVEGEAGEFQQQSDPESAEAQLEVATRWTEHPAGFWLRFIAYAFDCGFTLVLTHIFQKMLFSLLGLSFTGLTKVLETPEQIVAAFASGLIGAMITAFVGYYVIHLLYFALFESSNQQATPGKLILGLRVTDLEGERLSFGQAAMRHLASALSILTFGVGFVMAGFGERKQALHDRMTGCLVTSVKPRTLPELVLCFVFSIIFVVVCHKITSGEQPEDNKVPPMMDVVDEPATNQPAEASSIKRDGGNITYDDHIDSLLSSQLLWSPADSLLEVRFYPAKYDAINEADFRATVLIGIRPGETVFDKRSITACFIRILDRAREIELPCEGRLDGVVKATGTTNYLTGDVNDGLPVVGSFEGSAQIATDANEPERSIRWLLEFNAIPQDRDTFDAEHKILGDRNVKSVAALWDRTKNLLTLGYFSEELTDKDLVLIRDENSFRVIRDNPPVAESLVQIRAGVSLVDEESIESCGLKLSDLADAPLIEITKENGECLIRGELREGLQLTGELSGKAPVSSDSFTGLLSWKLPVNVSVIDVDVREEQLGIDANQAVRGYVRVGGEGVDFKSAIALYSPQSRRLEIGFYTVELNEKDSALIHRNRSFFSPVRDHRANLILSLRFAQGTEAADNSKIIEANLYVVRDEFGGFYFPGQYERQSIARTRAQLESGELRRFSGDLKDGATIQGLLKGEAIVATLGQTFSWKADFTVPIVEIK